MNLNSIRNDFSFKNYHNSDIYRLYNYIYRLFNARNIISNERFERISRVYHELLDFFHET